MDIKDISLSSGLGPEVTVQDAGSGASVAPFLIEDVVATGALQTVDLPSVVNLMKPPSMVRVIVRESPSVKLASGELVGAAYRVDYGSHTAKEAKVKITFPATAVIPLKFDLLVFPYAHSTHRDRPIRRIVTASSTAS